MSWGRDTVAIFFNAAAPLVRAMRKPRFKRKKQKIWKSIPPKLGGIQ